MVKIIATLDQHEEGIMFNLELNGENMTPIEEMLGDSLNEMIQAYVNTLMESLNNSTPKHILN